MRVLRRLVRVLLVVVVLAAVAAAAAAAVSQTAWFKNGLRGYIVAQGTQYLNGELSIGKLGGSLFSGVHLDDIAVSMNGAPVVQVESLSLDYNLFQLIARGLSLDEIRLSKPVVYLKHDSAGWSIARLVKRQVQEADREGPRPPMGVDTIAISSGVVIVEDEDRTHGHADGVRVPRRIEQIDAKLSFAYEPVHYSVDIAHVSFRASEPSIGLNSLSGGIAVRDDTVFVKDLAVRTEETSVRVAGAVQDYLTSSPILNLRVSSDKVVFSELAAVVPALAGLHIQPAFELALDGPLDRLNVMANVRSSAGELTGTLLTDLATPGQSATGRIAIRHLDLAPILNDARQHTDLTGHVSVNLHADRADAIDSLRGTVSVDAPRLAGPAYSAEDVHADLEVVGRLISLDARGKAHGATATAAGRVALPRGDGPVGFDLRGGVHDVDLRRLPAALNVPQARTSIDADYKVSGSHRFGGSSQTRRARVLLAVTFGASQVPGAEIEAGSRVGIDARAREIAYRADVNIANVDLQRLGRAFNLNALAVDRYRSRFDARIVAEGSGTRLERMRGRARGMLTRGAILGARVPEAAFDASIDRDVARVAATGSFMDLDPAVVSGKPAARGTVGARFDVAATLHRVSAGVTPRTVDGTVRLALEPSTVGGLAISSGHFDADYTRQIADIRRLDIVGMDVNVNVQGTLALGETGDSNLAYHVDSPRLAEIGKLFDAPIEGIVQADGTITGNRVALDVAGTLGGSGVKYGENGALTVRSSYSARVPDLELSRATLDADTQATFVTLAGQHINEMTAKTTYETKRLKFDGTAKQPEREADLAGALILHPEHQEVHLERLAVRTANEEWSVPAGVQPTIQYGPNVIAVDGLLIANGSQELTVDGIFGRHDDALRVTAKDVNFASVDALLLRPPQFTGTLNASARVEGMRHAPEVTGEFHVEKGGFRQFAYDSLDGTVRYEGPGLSVDARLQQNPTQWITAKGYVPVTALRSGSGERVPGHVEPVAPSDRIDLAIDSSPLGLGLLQGFTTALTEVTGTFEAHVTVTGPADDPRPSGSIVVADGALTVEPTGVSYTNIAGRVDLEPDRVHIEQFTVLDNHQSALSFTGDLAVHAREVGDIRLWITAEDFKIIDNAMGNVRVQGAMELAGELRKPQIGGWFGVSTGRINLDEIIAKVGSSPYSTTPIEYRTGRESSPAADEQPEPSIFDALRTNVHVTVPDDLVVRARNLRAPQGSIGLGSLLVTLGGDLNAVKEPGGRLRLVGSVNTVRGNYDFQGRRFEILRDGTLQFEGLDELNPRLDIRTRRIIQGVEARVSVRGRMRQPEIVLSSTPPLEEADVLALIVFNQPLNRLGTGEQIDVAQRAQALATGAVTGQLSQSIGRALNLDTFEISVAPESGNEAELSVGQQLGRNLYFKVQQGIGDSASTNIVVEYAIREWLRLQTNIAENTSVQQSLFRRTRSTGADLIVLFTR